MQETGEGQVVRDDGIVEVEGGLIVDGVFFELDLDEIDAVAEAQEAAGEVYTLEEVMEWTAKRIQQRQQAQNVTARSSR